MRLTASDMDSLEYSELYAVVREAIAPTYGLWILLMSIAISGSLLRKAIHARRLGLKGVSLFASRSPTVDTFLLSILGFSLYTFPFSSLLTVCDVY